MGALFAQKTHAQNPQLFIEPKYTFGSRFEVKWFHEEHQVFEVSRSHKPSTKKSHLIIVLLLIQDTPTTIWICFSRYGLFWYSLQANRMQTLHKRMQNILWFELIIWVTRITKIIGRTQAFSEMMPKALRCHNDVANDHNTCKYITFSVFSFFIVVFRKKLESNIHLIRKKYIYSLDRIVGRVMSDHNDPQINQCFLYFWTKYFDTIFRTFLNIINILQCYSNIWLLIRIST